MAQTTFAVTQDNQAIWLDSDGNQMVLSPKDFALSVTCDVEGTIWIVSTEWGPSGNVIKYYQGFPSKQSKWVSLDAKLGAIQVVGRSKGRCVFLAPDGSVHLADTAGGHRQITKLGAASFVAALGDFPIYILTNKVVKGSGNIIESTHDEGKTWQVVPNGDAARATQIFVQIYNFVVFLNNDGAAGFLDGTQNNKVRLVSSPNLALALGISGANIWWVVSTDADPKTGGNLLKYWDGGGINNSFWHTTTPPIPGTAVGPR
ncbi:MAG TPA: hypothetical protein VE863_01025 [Pyrinomonadaceae bacterium]|nr:hypothetical protein [Pyrinomonadaceae bacterium]